MKKRLASFVKTVKSLEREPVELKGNRELHDYAGMNPEAARVMGWPDKDKAIELDKNQDEGVQVKNLVHETVEQEHMKKGMSYHDAHVQALKAETAVKTPGQLVNKVNQIRGDGMSKHKVKVTSSTNKFFHPKVEMDWHKNENVDARREHALKAHDGDELSTARALGALANVTQDKETSIVARKDANYFYAKHNRERNLGAGVVRDRRGQHLRMD